MSCNFSLPISGEPQATLDKARKAVQSQGGTFNGDTNAGDFSVSVFGNNISGSYTVAGGSMAVVISEKPFLLPCSAIEGYLKNAIGS
ncbi:MAG: hypothetical protein EOO11_12645 [Chitinophagaceae bacterium]|nr:MAG: hypothetical protein EOO11_12645 [Chitinophagaceae bacterium]